MRKIQIDRRTWIRGDDTVAATAEDGTPYAQGSMLLRPADGHMCCVGQVCVQLGIPAKKLEGVATVDDLFNDKVEVPEELREPNRYASSYNDEEAESFVEADGLGLAYSINDDPDTTDEYKEAELIPLFAKLGLDVEFIN